MEHKKSLSIKEWAEEDKPREKMLLKGRKALSDSELIAILIGSGTGGVSAVELAQQILRQYENDLNTLGRVSIKDFMKFKGIGEAKAITIAAALELGRRRQSAPVRERPQITCSQDAYDVIRGELVDLSHEVFKVLLLNRNNRVTKVETISIGGVSGTVVDPKVIFKKALDEQSSGIILSHNHPSGSLDPSDQDIALTERLAAAGRVLGIKVLDHLIISERGYYSFKDEDLI